MILTRPLTFVIILFLLAACISLGGAVICRSNKECNDAFGMPVTVLGCVMCLVVLFALFSMEMGGMGGR